MTYDLKFTVVENKFPCLLELNTLKSQGFVTVNEDQFLANVHTGTCDLANLSEVTLKTDPTKKRRQLPCRKVPFPVHESVQTEIQKLIQRGVLAPVTKPKEWFSQMAIAEKLDGDRICIDPQALNNALLREHYKLPTLDDVLVVMKYARIFSKLDIKKYA